MKKAKDQDDEMRSEYKREDLGVGVRGKYYEAYNEGHNLVLLRPEVAKAFPSEEEEDGGQGRWGSGLEIKLLPGYTFPYDPVRIESDFPR